MLSPTGVAAERPNQDLVMVMALFAGCGLGGVAAVVADLLDARVRTLAEIRAQLDLPVIGLIPQLSAEQSKATGPIGLLSHQAPRSALAESYKSTRTNLEFLRRARRSQVLLISSAHSGDGKSTTSSNLAITLAQSGRRVLLIDGDLRKPSLHTIYNQHRDRGLTSLLEGDQSVAAAAEPTLVEHLDLVTTGPDTANPAELLASHRLAEILEEARKLYEIIIIDSSSLLAVTDPSIIAAVIDGIILVVRISSTRRYDVERTMELVNTLGIPALGVVVNGITRDQVGFAYGGHGYGNGYGRGKRRPHGAPPEVKNGEGRVSGPPAPPSPGVNGRITNDRGPSDHSSSN